jgi:hypothetical protein
MRGEPGVGVTVLIVALATALVGFDMTVWFVGREAVRSTEYVPLSHILGLCVSRDDWEAYGDVVMDPVRGLENEDLGGPGGLGGGNME